MPAPPPRFGQARTDTCTRACLRMVLAHHGIEVTESALEAQVEKQPGGVAIEELAQLAQRYGFCAEIVALDLAAIGNLIGQGVFPIVYLNRVYFEKRFPTDWKNAMAHAVYHAVVPTHLGPTMVTFNDPLPPGKRKRVSRRRFEAAQLHMNRWCVVCHPASPRG